MIPKRKAYKNKAIRQSARDECCTMQIVGICTYGGGDVVLAHSRYGEDGHGMGQKADDIFAAYMCQACHDEYDGRTNKRKDLGEAEMRDLFHRAMKKTIRRLLEKGVIG